MKNKRQHDLPQPNYIMHEQSINLTHVLKYAIAIDSFFVCQSEALVPLRSMKVSLKKKYIYIAFKQHETSKDDAKKLSIIKSTT